MNKKLLATVVSLALSQGAWAGGSDDSTTIGQVIQAMAGMPGPNTPSLNPMPSMNTSTSSVVIQLPQSMIRASDGLPMVQRDDAGDIPVPVGNTPVNGGGTTGGTTAGAAVVTAVTATAKQTYEMFQPSSGPAVPNMLTLSSVTSAEGHVLTSSEASPGTGTTINSATDAANYVATTNGVLFHSDPATGIYWGFVEGANPDSNGLYVDAGKHYIFGPPVTNMPTSGTATYAFVGSTAPSITVAGNASSGGGSGNSFTSGNFTANFSAQTLTTPTMVMNFPSSVASNIPPVTLTIASGQTIAYGGASTAQPIAVTCTTGCSGAVSGAMNSRFTGNGASGLAVSITAYGGAVPVTMGGTTNSYPLSAAVVAAYKKQ